MNNTFFFKVRQVELGCVVTTYSHKTRVDSKKNGFKCRMKVL